MTRVMTAFLPQPEARPLPDTPPRGIKSRGRRPYERVALGFYRDEAMLELRQIGKHKVEKIPDRPRLGKYGMERTARLFTEALQWALERRPFVELPLEEFVRCGG